MPSWETHAYWCKQFGINPTIGRKTDQIIDDPKLIGHDWIRGNKSLFVAAVIFFYSVFGLDGVKAMLLHGILDYMCTLLREGFEKDEILWRNLAWVKFLGGKHKIQKIRKTFINNKQALNYVRNYCWNAWMMEFSPEKYVQAKEIIKSSEGILPEIMDIQKKAFLKALQQSLEGAYELAEELLRRAYEMHYVNVCKAKRCSADELIHVAKEVTKFVENHFDGIIETLRQDPHCKKEK